MDSVPLHLKGRDIKEQKEALLALLVPKEAAAPPGLSSPFLQLLDSILDRLKTLYPKDLHYDESTGTLYSGFVAIHYTWYNRYSEKGDKDLPGPDKAYATRIVRGEAGKSNPYQRIPRESQEIREDPAGYQAMCEMLQPLFEWIRTSMAQYLPNEEYELRAYVEDLPLHSDSPCAPFGGYVVNFCVCTLAHRDHGDKILCVVCPMGQWEGGELVLYEAGLILALRPGDLVFFPSNKVTHFNMDFRGERVSFVMHSDVTGDAWVEERNGWGAHVQ
ncbi:hypothetical protein K525DRAFT_209369 [Schizophyllum commune Loenen D]|nr:hypothetical protein K525DRAFT_209369 [Schizophyllum commune Loenen D]